MAKRTRKRPATMEDAAAMIHDYRDPSALIEFLLGDEPISREDREDLAALFGHGGGWHGVKVVLKGDRRGNPEKRWQRARIHRAVTHIKRSNGGTMPDGAWDKVAEHFGLSRKAVESAYELKAEEDAESFAKLNERLRDVQPFRSNE
jgi:hypothetical protein